MATHMSPIVGRSEFLRHCQNRLDMTAQQAEAEYSRYLSRQIARRESRLARHTQSILMSWERFRAHQAKLGWLTDAMIHARYQNYLAKNPGVPIEGQAITPSQPVEDDDDDDDGPEDNSLTKPSVPFNSEATQFLRRW